MHARGVYSRPVVAYAACGLSCKYISVPSRNCTVLYKLETTFEAVPSRVCAGVSHKGYGQVLQGLCTRGFTASPVGLHGARGAVSGQLLGRL